ncbi:MAG: AAA family ATPase [Lachnospiraceae bacterium]|nr:AAA family ATPase [Lachnospiraceae bacterium]
MQVTREVAEIMSAVLGLAKNRRYELVTPELVLYVICGNKIFAEAFEDCGGNVQKLTGQLEGYFDEYMICVGAEDAPDGNQNPEFSAGMGSMLSYAWQSAQGSGRDVVGLMHIVHAMFELEESYAVYYMQLQGVEHAELLQQMTILYEELSSDRHARSGQHKNYYDKNNYDKNNYDLDGKKADADMEDADADTAADKVWQQFAVCLNDALEGANPLIGREEELERTMQILCRKEKNNPLHIGEPGVGKTAITCGLARLIEENRVPEPLKGAKIFSLDLGSLIAGTQFRGDFEKRFKRVMDSISREEKPIVYIDEIHNIVGAGAVNGGAFDVSNMLKPYLAAGTIRFIGATTYEEYKKHFEKSKSLVRRFQNIDIREPDIEDATRILEGLKKSYESFHKVTYAKGVIAYAVNMSAKYINERCLPDKAIDLIDEAGAYRRLHPLDQKKQSVGTDLIDAILAKTCQIPKQVVEQDEIATLATLEKRLRRRVYGQNEAVAQVVNAVKFSRAGLLEEGKPLASLLFVGPTGVGKTEIARSLADELGIKLIRFDMSEYEEKHAVAKLIGSPAGYVGYEEGGLLTEEIRKNPHAVLLLDEIEKAHPDIYNILLQVMDYATLTDNQGRKADFRNVIIIMTSNAGASRIGKHGIGFTGQDVKADVIMEEVKRIFQPEFRNRLNKIVVFHSMDDTMAAQITEKKLGELRDMLLKKKVELSVDTAAKALLKKKGITTEFGAREIDRVIQGEVKPLLVDEILFGKLKKGGMCSLTAAEERFLLLYPQKKSGKTC